MTSLAYSYVDTPIGPLLLAGDADALHVVGFPSGSRARGPEDGWREDKRVVADAARQICAYFAGELKMFDLKLHFSGTAFQNQVWTALCAIGYGETTSYGALAAQLDRPKASRAVGAANGANPLPIIVPCHRVIGANKNLTGFGGGVETKQFLLDLERQNGAEPSLF